MTARPPLDLDTKIHLFSTRGWCPVRWAHHPEPIKQLLRDTGIRPKMKGCYENCQRVMLSLHPLVEELTYCEGYITTFLLLDHAWLRYKGEIVDLTLEAPRERSIVYPVEYVQYTPREIRRALFSTGYYQPVDERRLAEVSPYRRMMQELQEVMNGTRDATSDAKSAASSPVEQWRMDGS